MIRAVFYFLISIFLITLVRHVIGAVTKGFGELFQAQNPPPEGASAPHAAGRVDELKKDPVCGTFVAVSSSVKQTVRGEVVHFCSAACRDKYRG